MHIDYRVTCIIQYLILLWTSTLTQTPPLVCLVQFLTYPSPSCGRLLQTLCIHCILQFLVKLIFSLINSKIPGDFPGYFEIPRLSRSSRKSGDPVWNFFSFELFKNRYWLDVRKSRLFEAGFVLGCAEEQACWWNWFCKKARLDHQLRKFKLSISISFSPSGHHW